MAGPNVKRIWWALLGLGLSIVASTGLVVALRRDRDLSVFLTASRRLLDHQWLTVVEPHHFTYPPLFALWMVPFTWMPLLAAKICFFAINLVLLALVLRHSVALAASALGLPPSQWPPVAAIALFIGLQSTLAVFQTQQFDLVVFAFALFGVRALVQDRPILAGALLGVAAALKCTPVLFLVYLLWKRDLRAAMSMVLVGAVLSLLPDLLIAPPVPGTWYLVDWAGKILHFDPRLAPFMDPAYVRALAPGADANELNQSLGNLIVRLFAVDSNYPERWFGWDRRIVGTLVVFVSGLVAIPFFRLPSILDRYVLTSRPDRVIEAALVFALMLLLSPMSSKAHFVALVLPLALVAAAHLADPKPRDRWLLFFLFALGTLSGRDVIGEAAARLGYIYGTITWLTIIVYLRVARLQRPIEITEIEAP